MKYVQAVIFRPLPCGTRCGGVGDVGKGCNGEEVSEEVVKREGGVGEVMEVMECGVCGRGSCGGEGCVGVGVDEGKGVPGGGGYRPPTTPSPSHETRLSASETSR